MLHLKVLKQLLFTASFTLMLTSCNEQFDRDNFVAYFGGEVTNPTCRYVLFCHNGEVMDTIALQVDNTFFKKFDSLGPGLYTFRHDPEYQYVYFDKNDSLMVTINGNDFDESIVFCGRGEEKNNYLMEMYSKIEKEKNGFFDVFEYNYPRFRKYVDSVDVSNEAFYEQRKAKAAWNEDFDAYAKGMINFSKYARLELYPVVHKRRLGQDVRAALPSNYYDFRKNIDFNDPKMTNFSPFVRYLSYMLNNISDASDSAATVLDENVLKLNIADTLFKNEKIKNTALNNIAFMYLLSDQNMENNKKFMDRYYRLSTDKSKHNEILKIGDAIQKLKKGSPMPEAELQNLSGQAVDLHKLIRRKTVVFFWTEGLESHFIAAHKKVMELQRKFPNCDFIAINLDKDADKWRKTLSNLRLDPVIELRTTDFEALKEKWVITKIQRTLILNGDGTLDHAFVNLFDLRFEDNLK